VVGLMRSMVFRLLATVDASKKVMYGMRASELYGFSLHHIRTAFSRSLYEHIIRESYL